MDFFRQFFASSHHSPIIWELLILMSSVWILGKIFRMIRLPELFGEILAGVIVGPVVLGAVHESEGITILAELGVFFLMLHAGLETDPVRFFRAKRKFLPIALGGMSLAFITGYLLTSAFGFPTTTSVFLGMVFSITSIAVSTRLFKDCHMLGTDIAHISMGSALVIDILSLILFSILLSVSSVEQIKVLPIVVLIIKITIFFTLVLILGDKLFQHIHKIIYTGNKGFSFTVILALAFGLFAEILGLHPIIGAFLAGLFIRQEILEKRLFCKIEDRIFGLSYSFLAPIFFASLAFQLDFSIFQTHGWFIALLLIGDICAKTLGTGLMAYFFQKNFQKSLAIGISMNTKGAVELIIASIGLEMGIISAEIFSVIVVLTFSVTLISIIAFRGIIHISKLSPDENKNSKKSSTDENIPDDFFSQNISLSEEVKVNA